MFSLDIVGTQFRQYLKQALMFAPQILQSTGAFEIFLAVATNELPFASRFRLCVNRVEGAWARPRFEVIDQSVCVIPSAKGATASAQI